MENTPEKLLQKLIQFDTSNPPGNTKDCIEYIKIFLNDIGIDSRILFGHPDKYNLYARIKGREKSPPLMLYGHVDVVPVTDQNWTYPPFAAKLAQGCVWGRGALDMKSGIAIILSAIYRAKREGITFPGDVILCFISDEEMASEYGARFLIETYPELFKDIPYAISEFGGFSFYIAGKKFYPIQLAEKQIVRLEACFQGTAGHGSLLIHDQAIQKLAHFINNTSYDKFPIHITPLVQSMIRNIAAHLPFPLNLLCRLLLNPLFTPSLLKKLGPAGDLFGPLLRNVINPTIVKGGDKINMLPSQIKLGMDGRVLPGFSADDFIAELRQLAGEDVEFNILQSESLPGNVDKGLYHKLESIIAEMDPDGHPVPMLLPGSTDARFFSRLGIQTYGFIPMLLPKEIPFLKAIHGADEHIPVQALEFGTKAIYRLLEDF